MALVNTFIYVVGIPGNSTPIHEDIYMNIATQNNYSFRPENAREGHRFGFRVTFMKFVNFVPLFCLVMDAAFN
jgi:hypothetical protein